MHFSRKYNLWPLNIYNWPSFIALNSANISIRNGQRQIFLQKEGRNSVPHVLHYPTGPMKVKTPALIGEVNLGGKVTVIVELPYFCQHSSTLVNDRSRCFGKSERL